MAHLTNLAEWKSLTEHHHTIANTSMQDWFAEDANRFSHLSINTCGILLDYSRNRVTPATINLLSNLARACQLEDKIHGLFSGAAINTTENIPALHTALRDMSKSSLMVNDHNIHDDITATLQKMRTFVEQVHTHQKRGITGKAFKHIVTIGIGGSHFGPRLCTEALKAYTVAPLTMHFLSSTNELALNDLLASIDLESTLFIISSKSFTTIETLGIAKKLIAHLSSQLGKQSIHTHFVAITAHPERALSFGIAPGNTFNLWEWVGGRYSIWSAIGLPVMLMIGYDHFHDFLKGAYEMDNHFKSTPFSKNMPVLLAMLDIWYRNFFKISARVIAPYAKGLKSIIPYLQQATMESLGKRVNLDGHEVDYDIGMMIFGEEGSDAQHSYHQHLHQGQSWIPVDFITLNSVNNMPDSIDHILFASCLSQAHALMCGKTYHAIYSELISQNMTHEQAARLARHQSLPGNRPSNILVLKSLSPKCLGSLLALYEHKIFVQSVIWNINAFDQWGVELGKQLVPSILDYITNINHQPPIEKSIQTLVAATQSLSTVSDTSCE